MVLMTRYWVFILFFGGIFGQANAGQEGHKKQNFPPQVQGFKQTERTKLIKIWGNYAGRVPHGVFGTAFSPDGSKVYSWDGNHGYVWDIRNGKLLKKFEKPYNWLSMGAFLSGEKYGLSVVSDKTVSIWEVATGKEILRVSVFLKERQKFTAVTASVEGKIVIAGFSDGQVQVWDATNKMLILSFLEHHEEINLLKISANGKLVISGDKKGLLKFWDVNTGRELWELNEKTNCRESVAISQDGKYALTSCIDKKLRLWNIEKGTEIWDIVFDGYIRAFSSDGKFAWGALSGGSIQVLEVATGKKIQTFSGQPGKWVPFGISPNYKFMLFGSYFGLSLWDAATGKSLWKTEGHRGKLESIAFCPDDQTVLTGGGRDKTIRSWEIRTGKEINKFDIHQKFLGAVAFSSDCKYVVSGSETQEPLKLWDVPSGKKLLSFKNSIGWVYAITFSPDNQTLLSGYKIHGEDPFPLDIIKRFIFGSPYIIKVWSMKEGKELKTLKGHEDHVSSITFSPDGNYAFSGSTGFDKTAKLWDVARGKEIWSYEGHASYINSADFSPDGKYVLSASGDKTLKLLSVEKGEEILTLKGHSGSVGAASFSPNGKFILSASRDGTIRLWDTKYGKELDKIDIRESGDFPTIIAFSSDSSSFLVGTHGGAILHFGLNPIN